MLEECAKFWRVGVVDLLRATYVTHSFAPHTHDGYAIGVIERGTEAFRYRGVAHHASSGEVVMVNPDEVHTGNAATPEGWSYRMFYPDVSTLERVAVQFGSRSTPFFPRAVVNDPELALQLRRAHRALEHTTSSLEREERLLEALRRLVTRHAEHRVPLIEPPHSPRAVRLVRDHLETHFARNTSLEELSALSGLSGFHLTRVFKRAYGLPPHALQTQLRVRHARQRLLEGHAIADTALEAGFSDQAHLTRSFKRVYGVTPAVYARG
jgi:AraC-like DNA-binding protein